MLVVQNIAAYAKTTKHCEIANANGWFVLSCLARRHSDGDSSVLTTQWYNVMLCI